MSGNDEKEILKFWRENKIFEKSLKRGLTRTGRGLTRKKQRDFVFYDGPPFANGLPHYGHILASIIKDVVPRYKTMQGFRVPRKWGWDCHGLPVEYELEKELGLETRKDIEKFGMKKFNEAARESVLRYVDDWKKTISRIGRWADMENAYKTMDWYYTESIWWAFKRLYEKKLIYEDYKSMHLCPRCETTLSNFEVAQGYKDIADISVIAKFELCDAQTKTYVLVWTTTSWTLPGNVALAINPNLTYCKIRLITSNQQPTTEHFILAKERISIINDKYEILETFKGKDLIGKKYQPLFDYYSDDKNLKNRENGWKIYPADFVTVEEGTGIVHIAPAFGEDDMNLARKFNLPIIQHVSIDGKFKSEIKDFAGLMVKPKEDQQSADIKIIKWLAKENKLFSKQKITHAYPHCWRCDTPLLNYAASSWFVKVTQIKDKLIENNQKTKWVPVHIKEGRFGKWLEGARDWAISRSRFWGAPLPVWQCQTGADKRGLNAERRGNNSCGKQVVIGSLDELKKYVKKSGNKYFVMRHGETEHNVKHLVNSKLETSNRDLLTPKGRREVKESAENFSRRLADGKIDFIFASDFLRAKETAEIVAEKLGYDKKKIIYDERLREVNTGIFDGKTAAEYHAYFSSLEEKFYKRPPEGENLIELKNRTTDFLYEIDKKYSNKNILIISHEYSIWLMFAGAIAADSEKAVQMKENKPDFIKTAEVMKLDFTSLPHNSNFELDLHRPYIDEVELICECGGKMERIKEVFDCWFESGAMPFAQAHFPFAFNIGTSNVPNRTSDVKKFPFPAEFIAEGLDQTRGWFYTLLVLSTALFDKPAYKNVIVNGIILTEDGQKMSKRLKNYPEPELILDKYGADALRLYLLSSPVMRAEDLCFSEKGVDEIYKKVILRSQNVYKFYELYTGSILRTSDVPNIDKNNFRTSDVQKLNVLDKWILARLNQLNQETTGAMDNYEIDKATRPIADFVDDLSTWYIRRSRDRFTARGLTQTGRGQTRKNIKNDKQNAIATTKLVLLEFSKIIAPFMPFMAETIYQNLKFQISNLKSNNSVHLENWPKFNQRPTTDNQRLLNQMQEVRKICSLGLEARQKAGIKVRQPLKELRIKNLELRIKEKELLELIKNEVNVKEIVFDKNIANEVELDIKITPELKAEGQLRELVRIIQDLRKEADYTPKDKIYLYLEAPKKIENIINKHLKDFQEKIGAKIVEFRRNEKFDAKAETKIDGKKIWLGIKKI